MHRVQTWCGKGALDILGTSLENVKAGTEEAARVKQELIQADMWSPYLEVGIGPDAEVFTKAQPMSSVGWGAQVGSIRIRMEQSGTRNCAGGELQG